MTTPTPQKTARIFDQEILKNAVEIIHHTGLLKNEVVKLSIDDVKQNGCIVLQIQPVSGTYPKAFRKAPVILSDKARELIDEHIKYLQDNDLSIFPKSPLFPVTKTKERYEETKLWSSLSNYCIYNNYERNREAGIQKLCWELSKNGIAKQQIIDAAHQFSRYSNIKRTEKLVVEGISRNPNEYERDYRNSRSIANRLIFFREGSSDKVNQYLSELQLSLDPLLSRDQKTIINIISKVLKKSKRQILIKDKSIEIQEVTEIRIRPAMLKKKKRNKIN